MDHSQRRRGDPIFLHIPPSPFQTPGFRSDGFRRGDIVLVSSRSTRSKIDGGRLGDSGDNEDHNRPEIPLREGIVVLLVLILTDGHDLSLNLCLFSR